MATRIDTTLQPSNSTDALFRAWVQFVHDILVTTGGWVDNGDTGSMTIATASHPTVANTKTGFRVYKMADTLQSTAAVYIRIDFGSGPAANTPGMWITVGQGSDGAGNISSVRFNGGASANPTIGGSGNSTSGPWNSYGSANTGRVQIAMFVNGTASHCCTFSLERSRDADGTINGDGLLLMSNDQNIVSALCHQRYIILGTGAQPPLEKGLIYCLSNNNPSAFGSDVGIAIPIPMKGVAMPPGLGYVIVRSSDFVAESQFSVTIYGASHNYVQLNAIHAANGSSGSGVDDTTARPCMLYE